MEPQKTLSSEAISERRTKLESSFQDTLQSYSNQKSMIKTYTQTNGTGYRAHTQLCICGQLTYYERGNNTQGEKDNLFNKCCWENWTVTCKKLKLDYHPTPTQKLT